LLPDSITAGNIWGLRSGVVGKESPVGGIGRRLLPGIFEAARGAEAHILRFSCRGQSPTANAVKGIFGASRPAVTSAAEASQTGIQTVRMGAQQFHAGQACRANAGLGGTAGMFGSSALCPMATPADRSWRTDGCSLTAPDAHQA
jgi:hypothetical protein